MKHNVGLTHCLVPIGDLNTCCFQMVQRILIIVILFHNQQKQKKLNEKKTTDQKTSLQQRQYWLFMKVSHIKTLKSFYQLISSRQVQDNCVIFQHSLHYFRACPPHFNNNWIPHHQQNFSACLCNHILHLFIKLASLATNSLLECLKNTAVTDSVFR